MSWVHELTQPVGCHGFSLKTHSYYLNQLSMINIHSISIIVTWPECQQPSGVTWPALISIIHQTPTPQKNNTKRDIRRYTPRYKTLLISHGHFSPHDTVMTPIDHPSGRGMGVLRVWPVLEVWPKFCKIPTFITKSSYINQKTHNSCIKQQYKLSMIRNRYTPN